MKKRLLAIVASVAMLVAMTPSMVFGASGLPEADANGVITLEDNVTLTNDITLADNVYITVKSGKSVTLNLGGFKLSGKSTSSTTSYMIKVPSGTSLTIKNGDVSFYATTPDTEWGGEGQPPFPGYANNAIRNDGDLIIDGANIENTTAPGGASYVIDNYGGSSLTVESGKIDGHGKTAIRMFSGSATNPIDVTINGGKITGDRAIWVHLTGSDNSVACDANVTITGGTLESTNDEYNMAIYVYSYGNSYNNVDVKISGGTLDDVVFTGGTSKGGHGSENVEIKGGVINNTYGCGIEDNALEPYIKGGQFNEDVSGYVTDNSLMVAIKDASGNTTGYFVGDDAEEAIENAPAESTIDVMKAPAGTEIEAPAGTTVENNTGDDIKVNGEALANDRTIKIEEPEQPVPDTPSDSTKPNDGTEDKNTSEQPADTEEPVKESEDAVDTGDNMNVVIPFAIVALALAAMGAVVATRRRHN